MSGLVCAAELGAVEAEIVKGRLASEGIESFLFDLGLTGMGIAHSVRVMVEKSDYAATRRILQDEGSI